MNTVGPYVTKDVEMSYRVFEAFQREERERRGWFERFLDFLFNRFYPGDKIKDQLMLIREGCEAGANESKDPVYMKRWFLWGSRYKTTFGFRVMLHKIMMSDNDRELHDHPWDFVSIILKGGYNEETEVSPGSTEVKQSRKRPGMVLFRPSTYRHRVQLLGGRTNWSLVFTSGKKRTWGFWRMGNFINHAEFVRLKCLSQTNGAKA